MRVRTVIIIVLLILAMTLIAQNTEVIAFRLWFWQIEMSRVLLLAGTLAAGVVIGWLLGRPWKRRTVVVQSPAAKPEDKE